MQKNLQFSREKCKTSEEQALWCSCGSGAFTHGSFIIADQVRVDNNGGGDRGRKAVEPTDGVASQGEWLMPRPGVHLQPTPSPPGPTAHVNCVA